MRYQWLLWLTTVFWGISFVATKVVVEVFPPFLAAVIRFCIAWVVLWLFTREKPYGKRKDLLFTGFWGISLYFVFENLGMVFTYPTNAVIIISLIPILNNLYLLFYYKQKLTTNQIYGCFVAFCGVCIVVFNGNFRFRLNLLGDVLILGAAISWVLYTHFLINIEKEKNATNGNTLAVTRSITGWGVVCLIPFTIVEMIFNRLPFNESAFSGVGNIGVVSWQVIAGLCYLGILCSSVGYFFWNKAIQHLGARYTTNAIYVMPVVTAIAESILLRNLPNAYTVTGGALVLSGLFISEWKKKAKGFIGRRVLPPDA